MVIAGIPASRSSPAAWLVAARPTTGCPAVEAAVVAARTVVVFPESGGGDEAADGGAGGAQGPDGVGLVGAEAGCLGGDGGFDGRGVDPGDGGDGEVVEVVEDAPFEEEVVERGARTPTWYFRPSLFCGQRSLKPSSRRRNRRTSSRGGDCSGARTRHSL
jgi:hypothetical protein